MFRCLVCGCSKFDSKGLNCALCGHALGLRCEQCYVTEGTKAKLLANSESLGTFGVTLEEHRMLRKSVGGLEAIGLVLAVADSLDSGVLRKLVLFLWGIAIPKEEILRLRLDEPEQISEILDSGGHGRQ